MAYFFLNKSQEAFPRKGVKQTTNEIAWLTRQVVNSQAVSQGKCSRGQQTTKRAFRDALKRAGLCEEKGDIKTSEWIECLKAGGTPQFIERNLDLEPGSFTKEKWKERGKH